MILISIDDPHLHVLVIIVIKFDLFPLRVHLLHGFVGVAENLSGLLDLALDEALQVAHLLLLSILAATRDSFHAEVYDCAPDLYSLVVAWDQGSAAADQDKRAEF